MKITKFGHCCLLIEEGGVKILIDPGNYSEQQNELKDVNVVLISHEHTDHFHIDSVKKILENNPNAEIITNSSVGTLLIKENVPFTKLEHGQNTNEGGVTIEAYGNNHALMHSSIPPIQNTGYFIANRFFYPGDAFTKPSKQIEILALPVAGPWMKLSEAIDYALELNPKICFPVHDGILKQIGSTDRIPAQVLPPKKVGFTVLEINKEYEF